MWTWDVQTTQIIEPVFKRETYANPYCQPRLRYKLFVIGKSEEFKKAVQSWLKAVKGAGFVRKFEDKYAQTTLGTFVKNDILEDWKFAQDSSLSDINQA